MVLLQISENAVGEPKNFKWGKEWRAVRIWKELRDDGEKLFALIIRKYGPGDYGQKKSEEMYIGREVKWLGDRDWDTDPESPTFGKRIDKKIEHVTEEIWSDKENKYVEVETPVNAKKTYVYKHDIKDKNIVTNYKSLIGDLPGGTRTQLIFIYESRPVSIRDVNQFFTQTVEEFRDIEIPKLEKLREEKKKRGEPN